MQFLTLGKTRGFDGNPNENLRLLPRRPLVHLTYLINNCLRLGHFPVPWKEAKITTLPKPGKDPKFNKIHFRSASCPYKQTIEKLILRSIQEHTEERNLLNASQFGFRAVGHFNVRSWRITSPLTSIIIFRRLLCSWISRKSLTQHSTLAYYTNCQN
jgi:hypothetical protein